MSGTESGIFVHPHLALLGAGDLLLQAQHSQQPAASQHTEADGVAQASGMLTPGSSTPNDDTLSKAAGHEASGTPESTSATLARPPSTEQPSTPDSAKAQQSAPTQPVKVLAAHLAGLENLGLKADPYPDEDPGEGTIPVGTAHQTHLPSMSAALTRPTKALSCNQRHMHRSAAVTAPAGGEQEELEDEECTVCWSAVPCVVFQPCGHLCCCQGCAQPIMTAGALCPMCRGPVAAGISI